MRQGPHANIAALGHNLGPLTDKGPIDPLQGHNVTNRAKRDQIEQGDELGFFAAGKIAALAQFAIKPNHQKKTHPNRRQMTQPTGIIGASWINQSKT